MPFPFTAGSFIMNAYKPGKPAKQASPKRCFFLFLLLGSLFFDGIFSDLQKPDIFCQTLSLQASMTSMTSTPSDSDRPIIIAVIDTGMDYQHPELVPFLWTNPGEIPEDGIDNDGNGYIDDVYGWDFYHNDNTICHYNPDSQGTIRQADPTDNDNHGTHLAGIIASQITRLQSLTLAGFSVQMMNLKVLGGVRSATSFGTGSIAQTVQAIRYAEAMGADICCLSWGTSSYSNTLYKAIKESSMLFVAAAGNSSSDNDEDPVYPASFALPNLISVASIDESGEQLSVFSNYGASSVDLAAPGQKIDSTVIEGHAVMSGTSMAAPQICAVAALLYAASEGLSAAQIKEALLSGGHFLPALEGYLKYPAVPDPKQSLCLLASLKADKAAPQMVWQTSYETAYISVRIQVLETGGSGLRTIRYLPGRQELSAFRHGTLGTNVSDIIVSDNDPSLAGGVLKLSKPGYYTFYLCDYAGNETLQIVPVWQSPVIYMLSR